MKRTFSFILAILMVIAIIPAGSVQTEAKGKGVITEKNPAVIIRTSFTTNESFNEGWGGVHTAVPIKETDCAVLYDVIIWQDRINLYKFPNNVEENETEGFDFGLDVSTPKGQKAYVEWRESFCLKSVKCKNTEDISKCSSTARDAYIEFFKIINKRTPSENVILKYSGHGSIGFCKCMNIEDTKKLMEKGVSIFGQKFALIDFGTNCQSSNTDYFQVYHSYTDYMLTSQLDSGGYQIDNWDYEEYKKYDDDYNYTNLFRKGETVEQAGKRIVDINAQFWKLARKNMKKNKIGQSMTLTDMSGYTELWKEFYKVREKARDGYGEDMYRLIDKYGDKNLKKLYKKFVIYYKDNNGSDFFKWDEKLYGITVRNITLVELSKASFTYNGKAQKPKVTVKDTSGYKLVEGRDYTVKYAKGRKSVGKYKVTVKLGQNYGGEEVFYFTIKPQKTSVSSLSAINDGFKIKWKTKDAQVSGYQIQYSTKSSFSSAKTVTVSGKSKSSKTVKKLKSKKKYYVRVRTYKTVDGKKIYSSWSAKKTVKTK